MPTYPYATRLAEQLASLVDDVPDTVDVVQLVPPRVDTVHKRLEDFASTVAERAGIELRQPSIETQKLRTVLRVPGHLRAVGFHASGAMSVNLALAPFDRTFQSDPGDDDLAALAQRAREELGLDRFVPDGDELSPERLWRIKAAGGGEKGEMTEPILCRAVGAFRHSVRGLPVYGRASATVELAAGGEVASASLSLRRFVGDDAGKVVASAAIRRPDVAAGEVAARLVSAFGRAEELKQTRLIAEWFRFGYLSLGRRHTQALLAPFYIASVAAQHEFESSAHVIAVAGSEEQYLRLPPGRRASAPNRQAIAA
jgi:hypothetical protein